MKTLTWQKPGQQNVAQELIKIIINYVAELRDNKITAIADYIFNHMETARQSEEDMWVDSYEVCTFLKISEKTLQRLRVSGTIAYSNIRGRYFYKVSEIRRMLEERLIRSNKENIDNLITNHQLYAKERGNLRKNK